MRTVSKSAALLPAVLVGFGLVNTAPAEQPLVNVGVRVGVQYTDNRDSVKDGTLVAGKPVKKEGQTTWSVAPWFRVHKEIVDLLFLDVRYAPTFYGRENCRRGQEETKWSHAADVALLYSFNPITTLDVRDTFRWSGDRSYYYGSDEAYDSKRDSRVSDDYTDNLLRASVTRKFSDDGDYAKLAGHWRVKRYDEHEVAKNADTDEWGARLDYMHVYSTTFSYGAYAEWTDWDRENSLGIDMGNDTYEAGVQAEWDMSGDGDHRVYASVGYERVTHEADDLDDENTASGRVELRLFQQRETQLLAGIRYGVDYSDVFPFSSQDDLRSYISLRQYFGDDRRFSARASVEFRTRGYKLKDDLDPAAAKYGYAKALIDANGGKTSYDRDTFYLRLQADYKLFDNFSVGAFYTFEDVDCDVSSSYKENVFGVNCTAALF